VLSANGAWHRCGRHGNEPGHVDSTSAGCRRRYPDAEFGRSIADLMDEAKRNHPTSCRLKRNWTPLLPRCGQVRAQGLPSISLVSKSSTNNQPASLGLGVPTFPATGRDWYVGVQVTIPIFEGFVRNYQVRQAAAQTEVQRYTPRRGKKSGGA